MDRTPCESSFKGSYKTSLLISWFIIVSRKPMNSFSSSPVSPPATFGSPSERRRDSRSGGIEPAPPPPAVEEVEADED